jgi:putative transposase
MTNHVHLLIERQGETVGRIMHRVLTGYSQYYNRKYGKVGHVFQGRHKAVLCQTDRYLGELVRYIHLNPVRAGMVGRAEDHPHSSHRAYLGAEPAGIVDVDSVLRFFGAEKKKARENFAKFVIAGMKLGNAEEFYAAHETGILGTEEFVDATIHRLGDTGRRTLRRTEPEKSDFNPGALIIAVETICQVPKEDLCGPGKSKRTIRAKEALIAAGREAGASLSELGGMTGLSSSTLSKRCDSARRKIREDENLRRAKDEIAKLYNRLRIEESKA